MKKRILIFGLLFFCSLVSAFNLTEVYLLNSDNRQEARIDNYWLVIEETDSYITGYFSPQAQNGKLELYYEGHNIYDDYMFIKGLLVIDSIWSGAYGWHYSGKVNSMDVRDSEGQEYSIDGATFGGFYNNDTGQIYVSLTTEEIGMSWVTFIQGD